MEKLAAASGRRRWPICWCCLDRGPGSFDVEDATTLSWSSVAVSEWVVDTVSIIYANIQNLLLNCVVPKCSHNSHQVLSKLDLAWQRRNNLSIKVDGWWQTMIAHRLNPSLSSADTWPQQSYKATIQMSLLELHAVQLLADWRSNSELQDRRQQCSRTTSKQNRPTMRQHLTTFASTPSWMVYTIHRHKHDYERRE